MRIQNMLTSATRSAMLCSTTAYNISYHQSCERREVCNSRFCLFSDSSYSDRLKPLRSWSQRMPSCRNRCFSSQSDKFENDQPYNLSTSSMTKESFCSLWAWTSMWCSCFQPLLWYFLWIHLSKGLSGQLAYLVQPAPPSSPSWFRLCRRSLIRLAASRSLWTYRSAKHP